MKETLASGKKYRPLIHTTKKSLQLSTNTTTSSRAICSTLKENETCVDKKREQPCLNTRPPLEKHTHTLSLSLTLRSVNTLA